jgi:hypothetical protein
MLKFYKREISSLGLEADQRFYGMNVGVGKDTRGTLWG